MTSRTLAGVVRTIRQYPEESPRHHDWEAPASWDVIPGRKVRNDGVYPAALRPGYVYRLEHDGIGWQFAPDGQAPHAYLVDAASLEPADRLELTHKSIALAPGRRYTLSQDDAGAWQLYQDV